MDDFEKLGAFYLGKIRDPEGKASGDDLLLYDSRDLVTHAVCLGMTGSGKTGLCLTLLEEAAIDGIPAIAIDPKGDLGNLLLTFPDLRPEDFAPWVNPEDAARKGLSVSDYAARQAETWKKGLASWGQDGARIKRLREAADIAIYTPGSSAGLPVSILSSFARPGQAVLGDGELLRERIGTTVTSLLGLLGIEADPLQSREHILLATILDGVWKAGRDLDLASLIGLVQAPPFARIGVLELESFYPSKERFSLVMALNNVLAAPGFGAWMEGEPLDVARMLHTPAGKPRLAIFSVAHLNDSERMFFVSLLLNQVLGWMRGQSGTTSLRAILYMDEIFGYFPPVANPPSKQPLLTLMKQARAFGLGVVLATQNPVDLDYKGLSNAGTWFIGRLQTERDKARVLDGLEGAMTAAGAAFDRGHLDRIMSGLGNRVFLMNNVHEDGPVVFESRWAMSYLRGPLTRDQIRVLMDPRRVTTASAEAGPALSPPPGSGAPSPGSAASAGAIRPSLSPEIPQFFIPSRGGGPIIYRPFLFGAARVRLTDAKAGLDETRDTAHLVPVTDAAVPVNWADSRESSVPASDLEKAPADGAEFGGLPPAAGKPKNYAAWSKDYSSWLYGGFSLDLLKSPASGLLSRPGETEGEFRVRLSEGSREKRDEAVERLRQKYAPRIASLQERLRRAESTVDNEQTQARQQQLQTAISFGATLLGAFMGRKAASISSIGRATTAARGVGRAMKEQQDVGRARDTVEAVRRSRSRVQGRDGRVGVPPRGRGRRPGAGAPETEEVGHRRPARGPRLGAVQGRPHGSGVTRLGVMWTGKGVRRAFVQGPPIRMVRGSPGEMPAALRPASLRLRRSPLPDAPSAQCLPPTVHPLAVAEIRKGGSRPPDGSPRRGSYRDATRACRWSPARPLRRGPEAPRIGLIVDIIVKTATI
jgi:hypothetical protein